MKTFFTGEWETRFGLSLPYEAQARVAQCLAANLSTIANDPCPLTPGKTVRDTHFVFLGLSHMGQDLLTLCKWESLCRTVGLPLISEMAKVPYETEPFATEVGARTCLYLVPGDCVLENLEYEQQLQHLPAGYEVSTAVEEVMAQLLHRQKTGSFYGGICYARTSTLDSRGRRIMVGCGESDGLHLTIASPGNTGVGIGLAIHRKIPLPEFFAQAA